MNPVVANGLVLRNMLAGLACLLMVTAAQASDQGRLKAFLKVTGFDVALDSIALSAGQAPQMLGMRTGDFGDSWSAMSDQVFASDVMQGMAVDMLAQTIADDDLAHAAAFYASSLGQRLVEVENAAHMVEDDTAKRAEGAALLAGYDDSRREVLADLNAAVGSEDSAVRAVQEIQVRFLMAASQAGVLDNVLDEDALRALIKEDEAALRQSIREGGLAAAAYTYREIGDADLIAYTEALNDPRMQRVYELMNAIQHEVMANRFEVLAERLAGFRQGQEL